MLPPGTPLALAGSNESVEEDPRSLSSNTKVAL
jgi:hypothetical protein